MCTPALHYLKQYDPLLQIDAVAFSTLSYDVLKNNTDIHDLFLLPRRKNLRSVDYDAVLNFHEDSSLGREYARFLKTPAFYMPPKDLSLHQAEQNLLWVQSLLPEAFSITDRRYCFSAPLQAFKAIKHLLNISIKPGECIHSINFIACHIGCHGIAKKKFLAIKSYFKDALHPKVWPVNYFIDLFQTLHRLNPAARILITGSCAEKKLARTICHAVPSVINLVDRLSLDELYALMKHVNVFITPDSGPLHVACCAHVPTIALFGPTSVKRTGPYPWEALPRVILMHSQNIMGITPASVARVVKAHDFFI